MAFNFGLDNVQATSSVQHRLAPWNIYPVEFKGCKVDHIQGKKDPSVTYDILKIRFEGEDGYYEESVFFPKESDTERPVYKNKEGHEYQGASNFERTMTLIAQLVTVICGEAAFKNFRTLSSKFRSFDDVCTALIKITTPKIGTKTNIKLVGRTRDNVVEAALPKIVAVSKTGEAFTCDNFIGDKLVFSAYEKGKRDEYLKSAPTKMDTVDALVSNDPLSTTEDSNDDLESINYDSLLEGL